MIIDRETEQETEIERERETECVGESYIKRKRERYRDK